MATATATIALSASYPIPDGSNQLPSLAYLVASIEGLTLGDLTRGHLDQSVASLVTYGSTAPASPYENELWMDTSGGTAILKRYTGSEWIGIFHVGATAPSETGTGLPWYDSTLKISRVYDTIDGLAGWHPIDAGLHLVTNDSGGNIATAAPVIRNVNPRTINTTTVEKDATVYGVTLEAIDSAAVGVIATCASGRIVELNQEGSTHGATAVGDGLVCSGAAGETRTVGALTANPYQTSYRAYGVPHGCFAEALDASSADEAITVRLFPCGTGRTVEIINSQVDETVSFTGTDTWTDLDFSGDLIDSDHGPALGYHCKIRASLNESGAAGYQTFRADVSPHRNTEDHQFQYDAYVAGGGDLTSVEWRAFLPTVDNTTTPTGPGDLTAVEVAVNSHDDTSNLYFSPTGYVY